MSSNCFYGATPVTHTHTHAHAHFSINAKASNLSKHPPRPIPSEPPFQCERVRGVRLRLHERCDCKCPFQFSERLLLDVCPRRQRLVPCAFSLCLDLYFVSRLESEAGVFLAYRQCGCARSHTCACVADSVSWPKPPSSIPVIASIPPKSLNAPNVTAAAWLPPSAAPQ